MITNTWNRISRRRLAGPIAIFVGLLILSGSLALAAAEHTQYLARVRAQAVSDVSGIRAKLEGALSDRLSLVDGVAALARAHQGDVADEFDAFAVGLAGSHRSYLAREGADPALRSLQLAPDAVVTYVWPIEGNEEAIGHDLLADPVRGPAVQRAIDERRFVLAGPFQLMQGGNGLVGRSPIYLSGSAGDEFWGFATVVINFDEIASEAGLDSTVRNGLRYALRGRDGLGEDGEVFLGEEQVFEHDPVVFDVLVPNGIWQLAAHPVGGWPVVFTRLTPIAVVLVGLVVAILVGTAIFRRASAQAELRQVSDDLYRIVHSSGTPIVAVGEELDITEWNLATERFTGIGRSSALGKRLDDTEIGRAFVPQDWQKLTGAVVAAMEGRPVADVRVRCSGVQPGVLSFTVTARESGDGSAAGAVFIAQDVTAQIEAEAMKAENVALARSARLKDEFLSGMSHELRTPLNAVIGLSSVLGRGTFGPLNDKQQSYVEQIGASGQHLLELINDVLDLAKIEATTSELEIESLDLVDVVHEAINVIEPLAHDKAHTIHGPVVVGDSSIMADRRRIRQVVLNLLSNAVKFTNRGGGFGVDIHGRDDEVELVVWDRGIGIAEDVRHLLFEPFQQIDGSLAREHDGTGLGLALADRLIRLHGGEIRVESRQGAGSRFVVVLPRLAGRVVVPSEHTATGLSRSVEQPGFRSSTLSTG